MLNQMLFITGFIMTMFTVVLGIKISKFNSKTFPSKKFAMVFATLSLIVVSTSGLMNFYNHQHTVSAKQETIKQLAKQKATQKANQKEQNDPDITDSRAQINKVNQSIAALLKEDQADQKNPPSPDPRYAYPDKIKSIEYLGNKKLKVQVTDGFVQLSNEEKGNAINYAQDCVIGGFIKSTKTMISGDQAKKGFYTTVKYGTTNQGHSTKDNNRQYQWSQR